MKINVERLARLTIICSFNFAACAEILGCRSLDMREPAGVIVDPLVKVTTESFENIDQPIDLMVLIAFYRQNMAFDQRR
jgi:hypothetical protein